MRRIPGFLSRETSLDDINRSMYSGEMSSVQKRFVKSDIDWHSAIEALEEDQLHNICVQPSASNWVGPPESDNVWQCLG